MVDPFSPDYFAARDRFRAAAAALNWPVESAEVAARGPAGEVLTIDTAGNESADPRFTVIISCGLHGIEGFFGSAVQLGLLDRWRLRPPQARCVLLHALNPYGFAWLRRTDERNVDLNRNFLAEGERYAGAPPGIWSALVRDGLAGVRQAIAAGQYEAAGGLFYGGRGPSPARSAIERLVRQAARGAEDVIHLDLHTGLGGYGRGALLVDYALEARDRARLVEIFGAERLKTADAATLAYAARGSLSGWCTRSGLAPRYLFAFAEFGTLSGLRVLRALRAENRAHREALPSDPGTIRAKAQLKAAFCPDDSAWRSRAVAEAIDLVECTWTRGRGR